MDTEEQLDTNIYNTTYRTYVNEGNLAFSKTSYKNLTLEDLRTTLEKHHVFKYPFDKIKKGIFFDVTCEYTGIHYHSIVISVLDDKYKLRTHHSLCYPEFISFIISKINYFEHEYPHLDIYVHESISLGPEIFHRKYPCKNWVSQFWVNKKFEGGNIYEKNKNISGYICGKNKSDFLPTSDIKCSQIYITTSIKDLYKWGINRVDIQEINNFMVQKVTCKNSKINKPRLINFTKVISNDIIANKPETLKEFISNLPSEDKKYLLESGEYPWIISLLNIKIEDVNHFGVDTVKKILKSNSLEKFKCDDEIIKASIDTYSYEMYELLPEQLKIKYENLCLDKEPFVLKLIKNPTIEQWKLAIKNAGNRLEDLLEFLKERKIQNEILKILSSRIIYMDSRKVGWICRQICVEYSRC